MTNTEAFNEAINLIKANTMQKWWEEKPIEAFLTPARIIWIWIRIDDYFVVNKKYPNSYRNLHAWEKNYYKEKENENNN